MKLRDFFYLHRSDRQILIAFLVLATIIVAFIFFVGGNEVPSVADAVEKEDSLKTDKNKRKQYYAQPSRAVERFPFDPNTADSTQLLRLGLQPWQVRNIYKYRAAGGIYCTKEDFARVYGLTVKQYRELEPYIVISPDYQPASTLFANRHANEQSAADKRDSAATGTADQHDQHPHKIAPGEQVDLNAADTAVYQRVPGIGSYYARRIADYGRRLGGFVSVNQLDEIDNFPVEAKAYFSILTTEVRCLNLNQLSLNELRRHPYVNYYQARAIVDYRRLYGPLNSLDDLSLLPDFPPEAIERLKPYVTF